MGNHGGGDDDEKNGSNKYFAGICVGYPGKKAVKNILSDEIEDGKGNDGIDESIKQQFTIFSDSSKSVGELLLYTFVRKVWLSHLIH